MKKAVVLEVLFVFLMLSIMSFLLLRSATLESRVYDEITYVNAGYGFITKKDFRLDPFNPPLAREIVALPLLFNRKVVDDPTLFWPRTTVIATTLLLALLVFIFAKKLFGLPTAYLSLTLFVFEPNILTNGHYATMDLIFTFFFILVLYFHFIWKNNFSYKKIICFSVLVGLTLSTKISALPFLLSSLFLLYVFEKRAWKKIIKISFWVKRKKAIAVSLAVALISLWSTYFFAMEPPLGYRFDPNRPALRLAQENHLIKLALTQPVPLGSYISTIKQQILFNYSGWYRKDSFVFGNLSRTGHPGYYFPLIILVKTPIPLLLLVFASVFVYLKNYRSNLIIIVPFIVIVTQVLFANVTLVLRYILPIYPLMVLYASQAVNIKTKFSFLKFGGIAILLLWYISGTLQTTPHYISFVNELGGGYKNGYKYVFDSNWDWGQGLIALKKYQDKHDIANLQLAYFGDLNPETIGIEYERIRDMSLRDMKKIETLKLDNQHTVAISATCWYLCGYYKHSEIKNLEPEEIIGGSILIFNQK